MLASHFQKEGKAVLLTREPGGTAISDQIRTILLDSANKKMVPECEILLYSAARAQHVREVILPALATGQIVLCDRFIDATRAYQGGGRGFSADVVEKLISFSCPLLKVNLTILLDCDPEIGLKRSRARLVKTNALEKEGRFEEEAISFHQKVRAGYLKIAKAEPQRVIVINSEQDPKKIHEEILKLVQLKLK